MTTIADGTAIPPIDRFRTQHRRMGSVQHRNRKRNNRYRVRRLRVLALKSAPSLA